MYPLKFAPVYKEKIWGGQALTRLYGRQLPSSRIGESWDVAAHDNGQSVISNGKYRGVKFTDLLQQQSEQILGKTPLESGGKFPLLVKLLDCNEWLSVQVHPDDEYARENEGGELGKTEAWVVLHAEPGAQIIYGVQPGTTKEQFSQAADSGNIEEFLHRVTVSVGDVYSVPAGTLHALGSGVVVAEVQQNSDTTYRVYDWGRLGDDGRPRELHIGRALEVIDFNQSEPKYKDGFGPEHTVSGETGSCKRKYLAANEKFVMERLALGGEWVSEPSHRFTIFMLLQGAVQVSGGGETVDMQPGETVLIPAAVKASLTGTGVLVRSYVPNLDEDVVKPLALLGVDEEETRRFLGR